MEEQAGLAQTGKDDRAPPAMEWAPCFASVRTTPVKAPKACAPEAFFEHCDTLRAIAAGRNARSAPTHLTLGDHTRGWPTQLPPHRKNSPCFRHLLYSPYAVCSCSALHPPARIPGRVLKDHGQGLQSPIKSPSCSSPGWHLLPPAALAPALPAGHRFLGGDPVARLRPRLDVHLTDALDLLSGRTKLRRDLHDLRLHDPLLRQGCALRAPRDRCPPSPERVGDSRCCRVNLCHHANGQP